MANPDHPATETAATSDLAGKYLTVMVGHESFGIKVIRVREIIRLQKITPVPQMPAHVRGVLNLRGRIIPVIDLRLKFQIAEVADTERTCIVVAQVELPSRASVSMGLIVDGVDEVANLTAADLAPTPDFGTKLDSTYILGMATVKGSVKTLLDLDRLIGSEESAHLAR
jgi:purine-binding chemotaxis protein CheW